MRSFRRPAALSLAFLIHAGLILALMQIRDTVGKPGKETMISLLPAEASIERVLPAEPSVRFEKPAVADVTAPKIAVDEAARTNDANSNGTTNELDLPPRPDPQELNVTPELPAGLRERLGSGQAYIVIVRALVLESGIVGDAQIAASCGFSQLDAVALAQVRDHWRFLPATSNGKAVRDWLSVEVLFRPA